MKILVYGAGVIGSLLAHTLCRAGNEVTLLARGAWAKTLEKDGLVIRHHIQRKTTVDRLNIIESITEERFDIAFAVMQHQQMKSILDDLAALNSPKVVLVGNNMSAPEMEEYILTHTTTPKTVLFGFQGTGGRRENGEVICVRFKSGSMTVGKVHSDLSGEEKAQLSTLFTGTKYKLNWSADMDCWYKCHLAFILPAAYLCYATDCNLRKATKLQRHRLLDAAAEAYGLLSALGYPVPVEDIEYYKQGGKKRRFMEVLMLLMAKTSIGDLAATDHCRNAVTEMEGLDMEFEKLRAKMPDYPMPEYEAMRKAMPVWEELHRQYDR